VDSHKVVEKLGKFPFPFEIVPFAWRATCSHLQKIGLKGNLRKNKEDSVYLTDNGNFIYDIVFENLLSNPEEIDCQLKNIPGVVETGLFFDLAKKVLIGYPDGRVEVKKAGSCTKN